MNRLLARDNWIVYSPAILMASAFIAWALIATVGRELGTVLSCIALPAFLRHSTNERILYLLTMTFIGLMVSLFSLFPPYVLLVVVVPIAWLAGRPFKLSSRDTVLRRTWRGSVVALFVAVLSGPVLQTTAFYGHVQQKLLTIVNANESADSKRSRLQAFEKNGFAALGLDDTEKAGH